MLQEQINMAYMAVCLTINIAYIIHYNKNVIFALHFLQL